MNFYDVFELLEQGVERFNFGSNKPDPTEKLPNAERKAKLRDGQYVMQRNLKDGPPADVSPDRGYARDQRTPDVSYTGDHRSDLSMSNDPAAQIALQIDRVLDRFAGRSYGNASELAQKLGGVLQMPNDKILAGLQSLHKSAPHLFTIDPSGQITINKIGNPKDREHELGGRYTHQATKAGALKPGQGPNPEELAAIKEINSIKQQLKAQEELYNDENVNKLARQLGQKLMGIIQDPSARFGRDLKEKAAMLMATLKHKYLEPKGLHLT